MSINYSPLRYPGGKAKLGSFLAALFKANHLVDTELAEPYAGGAGAALFMLFRGYASRIHLNDVDAGVAAFWRAMLQQNERFARLIERVPLTIREWDHQKEILRSGRSGFDLGFAFFYLNRTNRSGILNGGVIGGRDQSGPYLINARFTRETLAERVRNIGRMRRLISSSRSDAIEFINKVVAKKKKEIFFYLDPPYFAKGQELYRNSYDAEDHATVAGRVQRLRCPWLLTYDDCAEIRKLYPTRLVVSSELSYSAREVRRGSEVVILSPSLVMPASASKRHRHNPGFEIVRRQPRQV